MQMTRCDTVDYNWSLRSLLINYALVNRRQNFQTNLIICSLILFARNSKYQMLAGCFEKAGEGRLRSNWKVLVLAERRPPCSPLSGSSANRRRGDDRPS
jgi:hypothetical protein